ncbi:MAG: hypothetical protein RL017_160 [Pseudomonadota bacterium]|jgi:asparaginyl-tRNA synthetase
MDQYSVKQLLTNTPAAGTKVTIKGWVRSRRDSKAGISFIAISDGSTVNTLQVVAETKLSNYADILRLTKDCSVIITGTIVPSLGNSQAAEILAQTFEIIGWVDNPDSYPVSPKRHTVEYLREVAHLRPRTNLISSVMRVRNTISFAIHQYLQQNGFFWIHTPLITTSDAEGAGELFNVTAFDLNNVPKNAQGKPDYKKDFFGRETFLTVSGQLNVESYCLSMSKVYTFGPTFRAENSNTTRHLAEFWMVEPEIAFANLQDDAQLAQDMLKYVFTAVLNNNQDDIEFFNQFINKEITARLENLVNNDFETITYTEAVNKLLQAHKKFENEVYWGVDLASEHERWLCEELIGKPTIVTNYPKDIKAFYMRQNDDGKTVAAMDILAPGIGEIIGGSQREERYELLVKRMQEMKVSQEILYWYLDLRKFGTVPHAGFGLGLERLVSYITGVQNVRDIIPFPRTSKSATF